MGWNRLPCWRNIWLFALWVGSERNLPFELAVETVCPLCWQWKQSAPWVGSEKVCPLSWQWKSLPFELAWNSLPFEMAVNEICPLSWQWKQSAFWVGSSKSLPFAKYEALGSDYEPEKALGSDYEWKNEIWGSWIWLWTREDSRIWVWAEGRNMRLEDLIMMNWGVQDLIMSGRNR